MSVKMGSIRFTKDKPKGRDWEVFATVKTRRGGTREKPLGFAKGFGDAFIKAKWAEITDVAGSGAKFGYRRVRGK